MAMEMRIEERAPQPLLSMRTRTTMADLPEFFDRAFGGVLQRLGELGLERTGPAIAYYHNLDFDDLDVECGFPVDAGTSGAGEVQASQLPGGTYCVGMHVGPHANLPETWDALAKFATERGHAPDAFAIEYYLTNPAQVAPEDNQTLLLMPLK